MIKVMKFGAEWCPPCRMLDPIWDKVATSTPGVDFEKIDIDQNPELATQYNITAVPTMVFVKNDVVVDVLMGFRREEDIRKKIKELQ